MILPYKDVWPKVDPEAFVEETALVIGDVEIGAGSSVWFYSVVRGDVLFSKHRCTIPKSCMW